MALPEQIRKQSEDVRKLYASLEADKAGTEHEDVREAQEAVEETQVEGKADSVQPDKEDAAQQPSKKAEEGDAESGEGESYKQRYRTLQGMYNAEVPRLNARVRDLESENANLRELLASVSSQPASQQSAEPAQKLITQDDIDEYGDSIDVMRRVSREEAGAVAGRLSTLEQMIRQLQTSLQPKLEQVAKKQSEFTQQSFWTRLGELVPNWQEINNDPDFHSWLLEPDSLTGVTRQTYLEQAQASNDADRVARFFTTWHGAGQQQPAAQSNRSASSELEKQVAPGRAKSGRPASQENKRTYTAEDIRRFFDDVRSGKYKGREEERNRTERDIFAAQVEGRIVQAG